jgi:outer membrane lipoprotein SlyB
MKGLFCWWVCSLCLLKAQAQLFSPESFGGAILGGVLGGVIGNNSGHHGGTGAAIGAGAGFLLGAVIGEERRQYENRDVVYSYPPPAASVYPGGPSPVQTAVGGAALGAASGALIGSAYGHAGRGALIGAGTGLVVGSLAASRPAAFQRSAVAYPIPSATVAYPGASMNGTQTLIGQAPMAPIAPLAPVAPMSPSFPVDLRVDR